MKKKKQKGAWKRPVASVLGMVLVIGLTIVGTLAFLHTESGTKTNVFTGTNDIKLYLEEPKYNLLEEQGDDGSTTGYVLKDSSKLDPREYVPGETYGKDPTLYNTTGMQTKKYKGEDGTKETTEYAEEWVAMRVDYGIIGTDGTTTPVTHDQLTHDCTDDDCGAGCAGGYNGKGGIIESIVFDEEVLSDDTKNGYWIRIPRETISTAYDENAKYDIFVYKYKLKAEDGFLETSITGPETAAKDLTDPDKATKFNTLTTTLYDLPVSSGVGSDHTGNGVRTSSLFSSIVIKDQEQLLTNGYDIANLQKFEIKLTGAAIKVMPTNDLDAINQSDVTATVGSDGKTTSRLIVEDLVSLLVDSTD